MADTLQVDPREKLGSRNSIRLRSEGKVPAVLYGHKEAPVNLAVAERQLRKALQHNAKVVELTGAASGQAIVQDLQWDTFHRDLLHLDLLRVDAGERVSVSVPVALKGDAPGVDEGGVVEQTLMQIEIETIPSRMPEVLHLDATKLHLGGALNAGDIFDIPEGATLVTPADEMVAHCVQPAGEPSLEESVAADGASPEVIGKKTEESESE